MNKINLKPGDKFTVKSKGEYYKEYEGREYVAQEVRDFIVFTKRYEHAFLFNSFDIIPVKKENELSRGDYFIVKGDTNYIFRLRSIEHGVIFCEDQYENFKMFQKDQVEILKLSNDSVTPLRK